MTGEGVPYNKGIEEGLRTADGKGLWGQTRHHEIDGQKIDVTLFTPENKVPPDLPREDPFVRGVGALRTIFDSGDPMLISTIRANLTTFEHAVIQHQQFREQSLRIQKLEEEIANLKKRIEAGDAGAGIDKTGTDTTG